MTELRRKTRRFCGLPALMLLLSSCATYPPAPVTDAGGGHSASPEVEEVQPPSPAARDEAPLPSAPARTMPEPSVGSRQSAVAALLTRCQSEYQSGHYQQSVATAERALRIDRRNAEVYLWLAKNYDRLGDRQQSAQFAQRGLRYSNGDRSLTWELERVLNKARD